jgi:cytochrome c oxidase cbb3-type subunit 3
MRAGLSFRWIGILVVALATTLYLFAQQPETPPATPPAQGGPQEAGRGGRGKRSRSGTAWPRLSRAAASPEEIAQGRQIFEANCSFCHGSDARGGSGPNLLVTRVVSDDQHGELIAPIVHSGFPAQGMPKFNLSDADITDIAAFLHSLTLSNRGAPTTLDILVGNAQEGETYFNAHCTSCHSVSGEGQGSLAGIGGKYNAKTIQDMIVSGGRGVRFFGRGPAPPQIPPTTVTVTLPSGQTVEGKLDHISAFTVALTEPDGAYRTFARNGDTPKVVTHDPLKWHIDMLPKWKDTDIHNLTAYLVTLK